MGEFDFLIGVYDVRNRRKAVRSLAADLELTEKADWAQFPAVNTGTRYLDGQVVVDQYDGVFPDGRVVTLVDVHAYDPGTHEWSNTIHAAGSAPDWEPYRGRFTDGTGQFFLISQTPNGAPLHVRHTWDRITADSARFQQAFSRDGTAWSTNDHGAHPARLTDRRDPCALIPRSVCHPRAYGDPRAVQVTKPFPVLNG